MDVSARSFWNRGQKAYVDIMIFNPLAKSYLKPTLASAYKKNEQEKKRQYNERIINVEHATFTPMVFSTFGGMSYECDRFVKRLSELISEKLEEKPHLTKNFIRTKYSFSLLRTTLLCLRGSRGRRKPTRRRR